ncbi:MAG TPA: hypothetical protein VK453_23065 [Micromonosporaceae bacterium]|nr:hypothetical protein [Micromonosporaceae bacterium]
MGEFIDVTLARVPPGLDFSEPLRLMFEWVEQQGFVVTGHAGDLYGSLSGDTGVGTAVELRGYTAEETASYARSWFGQVAKDPAEWLWPFAQTGGEGSMAALWLDKDQQTRIVHLGSGYRRQRIGFPASAGNRLPGDLLERGVRRPAQTMGRGRQHCQRALPRLVAPHVRRNRPGNCPGDRA